MNTPPKPKVMSDDDIMQEIVDIVRQARSFGRWDRQRLRLLSAETRKRGLIRGKTSEEIDLF